MRHTWEDKSKVPNPRHNVIHTNNKLQVEECYSLEYVRVRVNNLITHPETTFDKTTRVVTITYNPWQITISTYEVIGKGVRLREENDEESDDGVNQQV